MIAALALLAPIVHCLGDHEMVPPADLRVGDRLIFTADDRAVVAVEHPGLYELDDGTLRDFSHRLRVPIRPRSSC